MLLYLSLVCFILQVDKADFYQQNIMPQQLLLCAGEFCFVESKEENQYDYISFLNLNFICF